MVAIPPPAPSPRKGSTNARSPKTMTARVRKDDISISYPHPMPIHGRSLVAPLAEAAICTCVEDVKVHVQFEPVLAYLRDSMRG